MPAKALMILGTGSDVGKSLTVAALCRILHQQGFTVAPFKAQNMSLNSFATREGHEIGRAQAMQAQAAGIEPHVDMNPILLKPTSDVRSQVILNGKVLGNYSGVDYYSLNVGLMAAVSDAYKRLANRFDIIVLEGAGSPVEMNLKDRDIVNLKMADIADAKCVLVADIDRGGVFGSLVGTYSLLEPLERNRFCGFLVNKFRGDLSLFSSGIDYLQEKLSQPCIGVIPYLHEHGIDDEDSVSLERRSVKPGIDQLSVCVVGYPYLSNFADFTALERQPDIRVYYTRLPQDARFADVIVLPGSKNTISDLIWLKEHGWDTAIARHLELGKPLLGVCGGFQMLGREIRDPFHTESSVEAVSGLNILNVRTSLLREKITRQAIAKLDFAVDPSEGAATPTFAGYEIHLGETVRGEGLRPLLQIQRMGETEWLDDGAISDDGRVLGTYLHGLFDSPSGLEWLLNHWRELCGKNLIRTSMVNPESERERRYDLLADRFRRHMNLNVIYEALNVRASGATAN